MHYYIDGYNVLFRFSKYGDRLALLRVKLIQDLGVKSELLKLDITLVFDSSFPEGDTTHSHFRNMKVVYTAQGETADEYILGELRSSPNARLETVVTSDKKLAWEVKNLRAKSEDVADFFALLNRRYQTQLHQIKQKKIPLAVVEVVSEPLVEKPAKKIKKTKPGKKVLPEECSEYYLEQFQKQFEQEEQERLSLKKKTSTPIKPKKSKPKKPPEEAIPDEERWLRIFEQRFQSEK